MIGTAGADTLSGGAGNDRLQGDDGNNTLVGGAADDTVQGDAANDIYIFNMVSTPSQNLLGDSGPVNLTGDSDVVKREIEFDAFFYKW